VFKRWGAKCHEAATDDRPLMVKCADEPKVEIVTTLPTVKLLMPMSGMERTVLKVD